MYLQTFRMFKLWFKYFSKLAKIIPIPKDILYVPGKTKVPQRNFVCKLYKT